MREAVVDLLSRLVAVDSVNPSLVPGGAGETEIASVVAEWARAEGLAVEVLSQPAGRPSVIVRSAAAPSGRTLLLCGHIDTVGVEGMADPFVPRVEGDRLYGRGAYDMKAGVAAALVASASAPGVVVAAVADEEHASLGVQEVLRSVRADFAVVTEPTELEVVVAHKGFVWSEVTVRGRAAHGSRPWLGEDAIVKAGPFLTGVGELDAALGARSHPLLGRGSVHASTISGGVEMSSYPARCVVGLERRTLPGETSSSIESELTDLVARTVPDATARTVLVREPFEVDPSEEVVKIVRGCASEVLGREPALGGASYWADAAFIAAAGIPTVMFGPGGEGAHAEVEWVSIDDTVTVARTLADAAAKLCG
ncbi:MAG TPA: M20/M25/M40 family metallo-hydrolase [Solirubrobacteraceae bacterium]